MGDARGTVVADNYRYWCGECYYRTPWATESQSAEQQVEHYAECHPAVPPGGRVEIREKATDGVGCLVSLGVLFLLLLVLSTCQEQSRHRSSQVPDAPGSDVLVLDW
jgi:hypothetical protein